LFGHNYIPFKGLIFKYWLAATDALPFFFRPAREISKPNPPPTGDTPIQGKAASQAVNFKYGPDKESCGT